MLHHFQLHRPLVVFVFSSTRSSRGKLQLQLAARGSPAVVHQRQLWDLSHDPLPPLPLLPPPVPLLFPVPPVFLSSDIVVRMQLQLNAQGSPALSAHASFEMCHIPFTPSIILAPFHAKAAQHSPLQL